MRITRKRDTRELWITQNAYINKLVEQYHINLTDKASSTLIRESRDLAVYNSNATSQRVYLF